MFQRLADGNDTKSAFKCETSKEMKQTSRESEKTPYAKYLCKALKYRRQSQNFIVSSLSSIHLDVIVEMKRTNENIF